MRNVISSLPLSGKSLVHYYPHVNVLSSDASNEALLVASEVFGNTLFGFFRGIRILRALKRSQMPPTHLFVEPSSQCNLACAYCYARGGPHSTKRLSIDVVRKLVEMYDFDVITVLGGEPLFDKKYLKTIWELRKWESFFLSTNGILLNEEFLSLIDSHLEISWQVSIEPSEWHGRLTESGIHQNDLLRPIIKRFAGHRLEFRVTIPSNAPYVPLARFIERLSEDIGTDEFEVSFWPATGMGIPDWMDDWACESYEMLRMSGNDSYRNKLIFANKEYALSLSAAKNKLPGIASVADLFSGEGLRMFFCDAGYGSIAVGPDGRLHGCHANAIKESGSDVISRDDDLLSIDAGKRLELVYKWLTNNMGRSVCSNCSLKYICGGGCFNEDQPNSSCKYLNKMFAIILTQMNLYHTEEVNRTVSRTQKVFEELYQLKDALEDRIKSEEWTLLLSGGLTVDAALRLAERYKDTLEM